MYFIHLESNVSEICTCLTTSRIGFVGTFTYVRCVSIKTQMTAFAIIDHTRRPLVWLSVLRYSPNVKSSTQPRSNLLLFVLAAFWNPPHRFIIPIWPIQICFKKSDTKWVSGVFNNLPTIPPIEIRYLDTIF